MELVHSDILYFTVRAPMHFLNRIVTSQRLIHFRSSALCTTILICLFGCKYMLCFRKLNNLNSSFQTRGQRWQCMRNQFRSTSSVHHAINVLHIALVSTPSSSRLFEFKIRDRSVWWIVACYTLFGFFGIGISTQWSVSTQPNFFYAMDIKRCNPEPKPETHVCLVSGKPIYIAWSIISACTYDTVVFLCISYRLAANAATERSWRFWVSSLAKGKGLFRLSKSLLQSGQIYYACASLFLSRLHDI